MWASTMAFSALWYPLENPCILKNASGMGVNRPGEVFFFCLEGDSHLSVGSFPPSEGVSPSKSPGEKLSVGVAVLNEDVRVHT